MISTKTLYNHIDAGIFSGISHKDLWEKSKQKKRPYNTVVRVTTKNRRSRSIEERPKEANDRTEYGHWEGDSVKSARRAKTGLLTLTERKTREQLLSKCRTPRTKPCKRPSINLRNGLAAGLRSNSNPSPLTTALNS